MTNNDVFRQLRYIFDLADDEVVKTFELAEIKVTKEQVRQWLLKDEERQLYIQNSDLSYFLDGLIHLKRGKKEDYSPIVNKDLSNNEILRKLKIALSFKDTDILEVYRLVGTKVGKHELSAFFRHPSKGQYQQMGNQYLRKFLHGLQVKYRDQK